MQPSDDTIHRYEPATGVGLLVDRMPASAGVAIGFWFPVGSAYEADGERGLSHFVEHMVFKGAGERDARELSRAIDRVGGYLNAFTERECVCLHCLAPAAHAELALGILLDMTYRPRFDPGEFEREKDVIANEILAAEDDIEETAQDEFFAMAFAGHPAARRIAGRVEDVRGLTFEGLARFHDRRLGRGPLVITVAGAVEPEAVASRVAAGIPARPGAPTLAAALRAGHEDRPGFRRARRMVRAPGNQVYLFTGASLGDGMSEDDFWRLSAASSAYGESMSSRLFMRLREEQGLCYSIASSFSLSSMAALWGVSSSTTPSQLPRFAAAYRREAEGLYRAGLEEVEVEEALSRMSGTLLLASEDPEYRMKRLARQFLYDGLSEPLSATLERIAGAVDTDSVNALVRRHLDPSRESLLLYGKLGARAVRAGADILGAEIGEPSDA